MFIQKRFFKVMVLFMTFILAVGTLLPAPTSYAAETEIQTETETEIQQTEIDPLAPQNLRVVADSITATSATIAWDLHEDATILDIDVWNADDNAYYDYGNNGTRTLNKLTPETTYKFYVTWFERPATGAHKSNIVEFTTLAGEVEPEPPTNIGPRDLKVVEVTHNTVSLEWTPVPGINSYWVWDQNNKYITWANDGAKVVGGLEPETTYSFFIGPDGIQAPVLTPEQKTNVVTFTTLPDKSEYPDAPLTAPSYLKVTDVTDASVKLSWGASPQATGYDIYVNGGWSGGTWDNLSTTYEYAPTEGLIKGQTYTFEVGAQNPPNKASANSNKVSMTWGELEAPKDVKVITATRTTVSLGWAPTSGATSYDIYQDDVRIGSSDSNRYVVNTLTEGQSYSFKVVAKNSLWESSGSNETKAVPGSNYNIVSYYTSWSVGDRDYQPTDVDVSQVTHINYAFSDLCWKAFGTGAIACQNEDIPLQKDYVFDGEMIIGDPEVDLKNFDTLATIKDQHPNLNLMVSVGGWSWSKNFSNMALTEETRRAFANSVVKFLREYRLDGIDIDWEYPVEGGETSNIRRPEDKENFTLLVKTVREALDAAGSEDGKYYLQTIASGQGDNFTVNADFVNSASYLDFINIMTYDYSGSYEPLANHNAPLYYDKNLPKSSAPRNNVQGGALGHLNGGVPKHKLVLGIPFYGKGWRDCPANGEYQTCAGGTTEGSYESSIFDFSDIEDNYVNKNGFVRYWNEAAKVAYVYSPDKKVFITYNDKESMMYNTSFLKSLDIAGVMSWDISGDRNKTLSTQLVQDLPIDGSVNKSALAAPQNLIVHSNSQNSIQVKWNATAEATGYEIFVNKQWVANTTETQYTLSSLTANTNYKIHVIAIVKNDNQIQKVSVNSNELSVTTLSPPTPIDPSTPTGPSTPSQPSTPTPTTSTQPTKGKDQLDTRITKEGDKVIVKLQTDASLVTINQSTSTTFKVMVSDKAKQIEVNVPKEIIATIAKKGKQALLSIVTNEVEYIIPIGAVNLSADLRITIQTPAQNIIDQLTKLSQSNDGKVLVNPLEFKIEQLNPDKTYVEIQDFENYLLSRKFTLNAKDIDVNRATGVVYIPGTNEIRSVPTLFTVNSDGTVTVELKRQGNSIYTIVSTNFNFKDVSMGWAQKDLALATSKLIATGVSSDQFGSNSHITRAEVTSMIVKSLGIIPTEHNENFTDVDPQSKYAREIAAAKQAGFIKGKTEDTFGPNDTVTRQEMAVMLASAMKYAGMKHDANLTQLNQFSDQSTISSYAKASLALMVEHKIIQGVSQIKLDPQSNVTKAQATVTVMRTLRTLGLSN
ncbi:glycosyl hydrolase family 18 protein [Paenibacillus sp. IHBB 10380]|uniref:glycosyl hydrolase family 18 protein n=1 Tax=Paenibacillus sp. IHBB 10380 TaxID=1566358 RepID=UPI0005CFC2DB|nr:glycosyl hydrolase family 18 protein [Paenibacillus sp. IHBB 10380]AJS61331.1 glycoside hydrolase [Paenibacillus sp. IHBB 10380]